MKGRVLASFLIFLSAVLSIGTVSSTFINNQAKNETAKATISTSKAVCYNNNTGVYYTSLNTAVSAAAANQKIYVIPGSIFSVTSSIVLSNGVSLSLPYEGTTEQDYSNSGSVTCQSKITFSSGADLTANAGSTVTIGAVIGTRGITGKYCEISLDKKSSITISGTLNAYGKITETNPVTGYANPANLVFDNSTDNERFLSITSTGIVNTAFGSNDMGSGTAIVAKVSANVCPTYDFLFPCLQTYSTVAFGGKISSLAFLSISGQDVNASVGVIFPSTSSDKSIFYLFSGVISIEYCTAAKTLIYVNGNAKIGSIYISAAGQTIDTDNMFVPIYSRFSICVNGTFDTNGKRIKFLPGASVKITEGSYFNVYGTGSSSTTFSKVAFYKASTMTALGITGFGTNDSELINNGSIVLNGNAAMGGYVKTERTDGGGVVDLQNVNQDANLSVTDVEMVSGTATSISAIPLSGPFYDATNEANNYVSESLFSRGVSTSSHATTASWAGTLVPLRDIHITVLSVQGAKSVAFGYSLFTNTSASDSGQSTLIPTNKTVKNQTVQVTSGIYVKLVDTSCTSISLAGSAYASGTWVLANSALSFEITPTSSFTITVNDTNGTSGAGYIKRSVTYGATSSTMNQSQSVSNGSAITVNIPQGWVFKVADNATVAGVSKVVKTTYDENGVGTSQILAQTSGKIAWSSSTIYTSDGDYLFTSDNVSCLANGTKITLGDGTQKAIEDLTLNDRVLSFDFEKGTFVSAPIAEITNHGTQECQVLRLSFDDETCLEIIGGHGLFDITENRYHDIDEGNYLQNIGHRFLASTAQGKPVEKTLLAGEISTKTTTIYSLLAAVSINVVANSIVTITPPITEWYNMFEVNNDLMWDREKMQNDIVQYGLFAFEEVKDVMSYEVYNASNFKYFKVAIGKGLVTMQEIKDFIEWYKTLVAAGQIIIGL